MKSEPVGGGAERETMWIKVEDIVPEDCEEVLGYYEDGCCDVVMYNEALKEFRGVDRDWPGADPTHWMALPEPPK